MSRGGPRSFNFVTPSQLIKEHPDEAKKFKHYVHLSRMPERTCENCDMPVWKYVGLDMCFTCTTGESDASDDYELLPEPRSSKEPNHWER